MGALTIIVFREISVSATKRWTDRDGKKRQKTRKFYQTVNPFNNNKDGSPKSESEIRTEIIAERDKWLAQPP